MSVPKFFYFDMGNVLLGFDHQRSARQVAEVAGCSYEQSWDVIFGAGKLEENYESGRLSSSDFHQRFCELTSTSPPLERFLEAASAIFWPLPGTIAIAEQLASTGYRLGILSNTCDSHWEYCLRHFPFLSTVFPVHCLSFKVRSLKPSPEIYKHACRMAQCEAAEIFFVDDRADNVAGARDAGIDAVVFTTPMQLSRELHNRGVHVRLDS